MAASFSLKADFSSRANMETITPARKAPGIFSGRYAGLSDTGARRISDALSEEGKPPNTGLRHDIIRLFERQGLGIFPQSVNVAKGRCKKGPGLFDFQTGGCGMVGGDGAFVGAVG